MKNISTGSAEFNDLLELINLLPKDWETFERESRNLIKQWETEILKEMRKVGKHTVFYWEYSQLFPGLTAKYSSRFRQLIAPKLAEEMNRKPEEMGLENAKFELQVLYEQKLALKNIIQLFQMFKKSNDPYQTFRLDKPLKTIGFHEDTTIDLIGFRVIETLKRNNIPIERVRECPVCEDIFWVKRIEKNSDFIPYCSESCGNTFNTRRTRVRKLEKEFEQQLEKLRKLQTSSAPNELITKQNEQVIKIAEKINQRKIKYGIV
jgi:hypothetical protein